MIPETFWKKAVREIPNLRWYLLFSGILSGVWSAFTIAHFIGFHWYLIPLLISVILILVLIPFCLGFHLISIEVDLDMYERNWRH